jgi:hypothetical protein
VIAAPLVAGVDHETVAEPLPAMALTPPGAPGAPAGALGVTEFDGALAGPAPIELFAVTVNVYWVPLLRPLTTVFVVTLAFTDANWPPGEAVAVYPVIGDPPSLVGAIHETEAWALPAVALTPVGAPGTPGGVAGVTAFEGALGVLVPAQFVAVTVKVYETPLVSPVTVALVAPEVVEAVWPPEDVTV